MIRPCESEEERSAAVMLAALLIPSALLLAGVSVWGIVASLAHGQWLLVLVAGFALAVSVVWGWIARETVTSIRGMSRGAGSEGAGR